MGKRKDIDPQIKQQAVLSLLRKEEPVNRIARRAGVSEPTLNRWRDDFLKAGNAALASRGTKNSEAAEIHRLRKEVASREQIIGELTVANMILKKTEGSLI